MDLDFTPANAKRLRVRGALPRTRQLGRQQPRSEQQRILGSLAGLPPAHRVPALRTGRSPVLKPSMTRRPRTPQPFMLRLAAGEFQRRLVLTLIAVTIFVALVVVLTGSFFV